MQRGQRRSGGGAEGAGERGQGKGGKVERAPYGVAPRAHGAKGEVAAPLTLPPQDPPTLRSPIRAPQNPQAETRYQREKQQRFRKKRSTDKQARAK